MVGIFQLNWRSRSKAAGLHLSLSILIAILAGLLVFMLWFPSPFGEISGGRSLFGIVVAVDVVLGPLLTWLVFDLRKPRGELVRDLATIGLMQLMALGYGLWSVYQARPVYLVYEVDRFVVVSAADVDPADLPAALPEFQKLPFSGIRVIGIRESKDGQERLRSFELALAGKDRSLRPDYWQELSEANRTLMRQRALPLRTLMARSVEDREALTRWLAANDRSENELLYLPVTGADAVWTVLIDVKTLEFVDYVAIDGF
ncbi:TfpX/TfpZ family type IV pilin accessory protein [Hydrogenophaga sp.]|uniref:TfpX/TfpZ family type IV pilin accessory protein n=1 Tax=Hydrogenophaga sp. TaxID=1904254 RepID=UPI002729ACC6|nr:TfpX/TfpZ family type IV pilin accessory protein [Hydrogenophaga sp.]